jgi:hypothetical protein
MEDREPAGRQSDPRTSLRTPRSLTLATARAERFAIAALAAVAAILALPGCGPFAPKDPDTHVESPYPRTRVVAIAPFVNQSGSREVEPLAVSDLFFSEVQKVRNFQVLPINRTLQAMDALRMHSLASPADAVRLASAMGADVIFVGAITSYNPYDPPEIGVALQLYAVPGHGPDGATLIDPASGSAEPPGQPGRKGAASLRPRAQINEIYNARHEIVQKQIKEYAELRGGKQSPLGWRLYTKSIQEYMRFCCYQSIRQVLQLEQDQIWLSDRNSEPGN